jgi:hypothetical protein
MDKQRLKALMSESDEALFIELGHILLVEGLGFGPEDIDRQLRFAQTWLDARIAQLRQSICSEPALRAVIDDSSGSLLLDVAAVADFLATSYGHAAASVVAVILTRRGLKLLCYGNPC